jgi:hypothetical protein
VSGIPRDIWVRSGVYIRKVMVRDFSAPAETDTAVVLASDGNFLPFGLHLIRQILVQPEA